MLFWARTINSLNNVFLSVGILDIFVKFSQSFVVHISICDLRNSKSQLLLVNIREGRFTVGYD